MKTWDELFDSYLTHLKTTRHTAKTIAMNVRYLDMFRDFCHDHDVLRPADATADHATAFERRLQWEPGPRGRVYSPATIQTTVMIVRRFFRYAVRERLLLVDPFRDVKIHRVLHNLTRRYLTVEDVRRLLERPRSYTLPGLRDKAILELLYGTGVRCKECVNLDVTDVDFETGMVLVRDGKGGKSRFQPMADTLKAALQDYLTRGRPHMVRRKADCGALFLMVNGARLPRHQLANLVARYAEQAELGRVTIHMLRHAFAQHLLQGGAQLEEVQQLLGHERIQTTSTYTGIRPVDVKKDHRKSHPRARTKPGRKTGPPSGPAPQPAAKERRQE